MISSPPDFLVQPIIEAALAEDLGRAGDITSRACVAEDARMPAVFRARRPGVIAGLACARLAISALDPTARFAAQTADGDSIAAGAVLAKVEANARALLGAERVGLNLLSRLSGIATLTAAYVVAVAGTEARIVDTRKTTPGLRMLEKHAVRCGGGDNHRFGLDDAILIKDNHVVAAGSIREALRRARGAAGHLVKVQIEVDSLAQLDEALASRDAPDVIMLDNFTLADLVTAVARTAGRARLEASGGIDLTTVAAVAAAGVDQISVGALTHSAPALDIGLDAV
ncbi:MAG: carboxylating nicotinate-nucleotide diphosphorylase [Caulobacteraceae bacterium]